MSDITSLSVCELSRLLEDRELSSLELTTSFIENIAKNEMSDR